VGNPAIERELGRLRMAGASDAQIRTALGLVRVGSKDVRGSVAPTSSSSVVSISRPVVYYDTKARSYYVEAGWTFTGYPDSRQSAGNQAIGGLDGFGVRFSRDVLSSGGSLYVCPISQGGPAHYSCFYPTSYWENSADGTTWKFQDRVYSDPLVNQLNVGRGSLVKSFRRLDSACLQIGTTYAHSWNKSAVNGFGVAHDGFSV
jgi:hypothetical protein